MCGMHTRIGNVRTANQDICLSGALHSLTVLNQMGFLSACVGLEHVKLSFFGVVQMIKYQ